MGSFPNRTALVTFQNVTLVRAKKIAMVFSNSAKTFYRASATSGILMAGGVAAILIGLFLLY